MNMKRTKPKFVRWGVYYSRTAASYLAFRKKPTDAKDLIDLVFVGMIRAKTQSEAIYTANGVFGGQTIE